MSKVVRAVGRAIGGVVKGVFKAFKKVAQSKLGKVILTAAAVYFGGAALAGGISSSAAGGSFLSGMGTGVANAASGLSSAWSSVMSGNISGAGSALSSGFQGQAAGAAANAAGGALTGATSTGLPTVAAGGAAGGAAGAAGQMSLGQGMVSAAKISAGTQLVGGLIQGVGQQKAMEDQREYEAQMAQQQRDRYNANVGSRLWGDAPTGDTRTSPQNGTYDPVAEARAIAEKRRAEFDAAYPQQGIVARGMQFQQPQTNNNFPIYNPMYYRG